MFKKTKANPQLDMFSDPSLQMGKRATKKYNDPKAWHNQFFKMITSRIDEDMFRPLFKDGNMGAPNSSVRIIVSMSILKEGFGCSDEELFEKCEFDLLTRRALGLVNLSDKLPSIDTYYLFRRRTCAYYDEQGVDLMKSNFEHIAGEQVKELNISGKCVRMDSKLIGSNIAKYSRYELILLTLTKFLSHGENMSVLSGDLLAMAKDYMKEDPSKTVYRSDKEVLQNRLSIIGSFIHSILPLYGDTSADIDILRRVFDDQYEVSEEGEVTLRDKKKISANSLQSPYDKDASFRNKHDQKVSGYVTNITETVEEGKPSIITSVQTETATKADCHMLQEAVANSEKVTGTQVETVYADGAYQSPENRDFAAKHDNMQLKTGKMQGGGRWELFLHDGDKLTVKITFTSQQDMSFVFVKDLRAAGFEPIEQISRYEYNDRMSYYQSNTDTDMEFFIEFLPKGTHQLEYSMFVTKEGYLNNGYALIQCQYAPEFSAYSDGMKVKVGE